MQLYITFNNMRQKHIHSLIKLLYLFESHWHLLACSENHEILFFTDLLLNTPLQD